MRTGQVRVEKGIGFVPEEHSSFSQPVIYVYGGGPSLKGFDTSLLRDKFVLGCNDAYVFGEDIVNVVCFGDQGWWRHHKDKVRSSYTGLVLSSAGRSRQEEGVHWVKRLPHGLHSKTAVGWNSSTGAMSINMALRFGAMNVVILGMDGGRNKENESNWHPNLISNTKDSAYKRFIKGFDCVQENLEKVFPGACVVNANPTSRIECFPKMTIEEALERY